MDVDAAGMEGRPDMGQVSRLDFRIDNLMVFVFYIFVISIILFSMK